MAYSTTTMQRARALAADGFPVNTICRILGRELGESPARDTVHRWVDDEYRLRKNAQVATSQRTVAAGGGRFSLPSSAPEYQAAFVRRLRAESVTWVNVARVCSVVFGGRWDERRVQRMAEEAA